jgi:hypothetical protein
MNYLLNLDFYSHLSDSSSVGKGFAFKSWGILCLEVEPNTQWICNKYLEEEDSQ